MIFDSIVQQANSRTPVFTMEDDRPRSISRHRLRSVGPSTIGAGVIAAGIVLAAIFAPVIAPYAPNKGDIANALAGIGAHGHLFGTDGQGRDILSRLIWGARLSLLTGFVPVAISAFVGTALGLVAALGSRRLHAGI